MHDLFTLCSLLTLHVMIYTTFPRITAGGDYRYFCTKRGQ